MSCAASVLLTSSRRSPKPLSESPILSPNFHNVDAPGDSPCCPRMVPDLAVALTRMVPDLAVALTGTGRMGRLRLCGWSALLGLSFNLRWRWLLRLIA